MGVGESQTWIMRKKKMSLHVAWERQQRHPAEMNAWPHSEDQVQDQG